MDKHGLESSREYRYGGFVFQPDKASLIDQNGREAELRAQTCDLFLALSKRPNELVTREELIQSLWPNTVVTDASLTQCVAELRKAIGDSDKKILVTVPRKGYRLVPDPIEPETQNRRVATPSPVAGSLRSFAGLPIKAALFTLLTGLGIAMFLINKAEPDLQQQVQVDQKSPIMEADRGQPALAIVHFDNLSDLERLDRLAAGITSDLVAATSAAHWLQVFRFDEIDETATIDDDRYDLRLLLDGTIQQSDEALIVTASLTDLESRRVLWSERWLDQQSAFFDIQHRIIERIDSTLSTVWTGVVSQTKLNLARTNSTNNLDAYDLFVLAAAHKHQFSTKDYDTAETYLQQALSLDPAFDKAWALLSMVHGIQAATAPSLKDAVVYSEKRLHAAKQAVLLAPNDSDSLMVQSFVHGWYGDFEKATATAREAVRRSPNNSDLLASLAWDSARRTHLGYEAVEWALKAIALHHRPPTWYRTALGVAAFNAGSFKIAIDALSDNPGEAVHTNYYYLSLALALDGQLQEARATADIYNKLPLKCWCFSHPAVMGNGTQATNALHEEGVALAGVDVSLQLFDPPMSLAKTLLE